MRQHYPELAEFNLVDVDIIDDGEALSRIDPKRFMLFAATNRMDIAFGELRERDFKKLSERFLDDAARQGAAIFSLLRNHPFDRPIDLDAAGRVEHRHRPVD